MYHSTRGESCAVTAAQAIVAGIAPDGGLYAPIEIPVIDLRFISQLAEKSYQDRAKDILALFMPEFTELELRKCILNAYNLDKFSNPAIAPLRLIEDGPALLELWHGPTAAFKDMALQLLPQLLSESLVKTNTETQIAILVATSGDTGKAALEGFRDVDRTEIIVFYPIDGVSEVQRLQMVTQQGRNVAVAAVKGNFDDAQTGVKRIFVDKEFNRELLSHGICLSSANSINWGRLLPQVVYYFSAYADMVSAGRICAGEAINFSVPTGNFGNILAGYYAKRMGLPIGRLICASNQNNVLTEFINTGIYDRNRNFHQTISPSMDILVSSNLERLLFHLTGEDSSRVFAWQHELTVQGSYCIDMKTHQAVADIFWADWSDDDATKATIAEVYNQYKYLLDPHTAVAWRAYQSYLQATQDHTPCVIVSTASPFKFCESVLSALCTESFSSIGQSIGLLDDLSKITGLPVPGALASLAGRPQLHRQVCDKNTMREFVAKHLLG